MGSRHLAQGLCCEVSQRNLHSKTLWEGAPVATGKRVIVHHQTMTNKPHRHFQLGLVGGETHQTEFFTTFVSYLAASGESNASFFIPHPNPPRIPSQLANQGEEVTHHRHEPSSKLERPGCMDALQKLSKAYLEASVLGPGSQEQGQG